KLKAGHYDLCFIDLMLGENDDYSGLKLIPLAVSKGIYSVVMSSCDTEETIGRAYALGCKEFYVKGNERANVTAIIARYLHGSTSKKVDVVFSKEFITNDSGTRNGEGYRYGENVLFGAVRDYPTGNHYEKPIDESVIERNMIVVGRE
ncbi:MAG: hypothetical protein UX75_C0058G0008, partial [Candidatus Moranbacteria bacterium GW2011_GWE2_47_10]